MSICRCKNGHFLGISPGQSLTGENTHQVQRCGVAQEPLFRSIDLTSFYGSRKICPFCCTSPMKLFDGNQKRFLAAICAQSKNLSAHLCITPTLAPQITSHLLVISSFPNLARFPHPLASRTV